MKATSVKPFRCAIYTRVSTDQGLDQEFNSLDAQYDASSAYIKSQGWMLIKARYDEGRPTDPIFRSFWTTFAPARSTSSSSTK
jgi:DNA invertase Pin-like site-specific DNA recombinase